MQMRSRKIAATVVMAHLTLATILSVVFLAVQPDTAAGAVLGFTPTPSPEPPTDTPVPEPSPTNTPRPAAKQPPTPTVTPVVMLPESGGHTHLVLPVLAGWGLLLLASLVVSWALQRPVRKR
jgi:hypothetical protein